jgi:hypothetical protein
VKPPREIAESTAKRVGRKLKRAPRRSLACFRGSDGLLHTVFVSKAGDAELLYDQPEAGPARLLARIESDERAESPRLAELISADYETECRARALAPGEWLGRPVQPGDLEGLGEGAPEPEAEADVSGEVSADARRDALAVALG